MRILFAGGISPKWKKLDRLLAQGQDNFISWCYGDPAEVMTYCEKITPCILIVREGFLAKLDEAEFARQIDYGQAVQVLVEVDRCDSDTERALMRRSCSGVLAASCPLRIMRKAIDALGQGQLWYTRSSTAAQLREFVREESQKLTEREYEILDLIGGGLKNHEIAERLFISPETVRWHIRSLYNKLGVHDRVNAAVRARFFGSIHRLSHTLNRLPDVEPIGDPALVDEQKHS